MNRRWMAALLAATTMVAGVSPAMVRAQDLRMNEGPRGGPGGGLQRSGPGGPAGRVERSEGRPIFNDRAAFPENRPGFRPDRPEAPRPPAPERAPEPGPRNDRWRDRPEPSPAPLPGEERAWGNRGGGWRDRPQPGPQPAPMPRPDPVGPGGVRVDRPGPGPGDWRNDRRAQWQEQQRRDDRWRDDERRQREDRDRWRRNYGDWRDHNDQSYGFAERRAWADQWNRGWRRDRRYDWLGWRSLNRGAYHLPRYYAPYGGYGYQRFSSGVILEPMFFDQNYWLGDPYAYRLPPAYGSYRWVRYYNDAILVDLRSGLVVDVVYDIFW
ncbi:RcnB family protein [Sphingomonas sanguinis]|nr:RcnB family protein [Sphingomonas sanguinis]